MMFVNSGYTVDGGMPGNVVLAFSVDGEVIRTSHVGMLPRPEGARRATRELSGRS